MKQLPLGVLLVGMCVWSGCQKQEPSTSLAQASSKRLNKGKERPIPPGLKMRVIKKAQKHSPQPAIGNTVAVHYQSWIQKSDGSRGRLVDSSFVRKQPLTFTLGLNEVIRGFEIGISFMQIGEVRELIIAPELAYGKKGIGLFVPPDTTLEFEVTLLGFS